MTGATCGRLSVGTSRFGAGGTGSGSMAGGGFFTGGAACATEGSRAGCGGSGWLATTAGAEVATATGVVGAAANQTKFRYRRVF